MTRVHFRNGVWQVVVDWQVVDAEASFASFSTRNPSDIAWITQNLDPGLSPDVKARLLDSLASGTRAPRSAMSRALPLPRDSGGKRTAARGLEELS